MQKPPETRAYIRPLAEHEAPHLPRKSHRQSGGDQGTPGRPPDRLQITKRRTCHAKATAEQRRPRDATAHIRLLAEHQVPRLPPLPVAFAWQAHALGALQGVRCTPWRPLVSAALPVAFAWQARHLVLCKKSDVRRGVPWSPLLCGGFCVAGGSTWCSARGRMYAPSLGPPTKTDRLRMACNAQLSQPLENLCRCVGPIDLCQCLLLLERVVQKITAVCRKKAGEDIPLARPLRLLRFRMLSTPSCLTHSSTKVRKDRARSCLYQQR